LGGGGGAAGGRSRRLFLQTRRLFLLFSGRLFLSPGCGRLFLSDLVKFRGSRLFLQKCRRLFLRVEAVVCFYKNSHFRPSFVSALRSFVFMKYEGSLSARPKSQGKVYLWV
jgi:hypothetical protein